MSRALVFDLDGTLLDGSGQLNQATIEALLRARFDGWHLAVATARPLRLVVAVLGGHASLFDGLIVSNGAATVAGRGLEVIDVASLSRRPLHRAMRLARLAWSDCGFGWESGEGFLHDRQFAQIAAERTIIRHLERPPADTPPERAHQVVVATARPHSASDLSRLATSVGGRFTVTDSAGGVIEISSRAADKSHAMLRWARRMGVRRNDIVAFGDGLNDVRMLGAAGVSVAMANATPELMSVATHVTLANTENGVADFLHRRLLGPGSAGGQLRWSAAV